MLKSSTVEWLSTSLMDSSFLHTSRQALYTFLLFIASHSLRNVHLENEILSFWVLVVLLNNSFVVGHFSLFAWLFAVYSCSFLLMSRSWIVQFQPWSSSTSLSRVELGSLAHVRYICKLVLLSVSWVRCRHLVLVDMDVLPCRQAGHERPHMYEIYFQESRLYMSRHFYFCNDYKTYSWGYCKCWESLCQLLCPYHFVLHAGPAMYHPVQWYL